jgi:glucose/arabinose dehydrogenase
VGAWLQRLQVPAGFSVAHVGRFPGQVMQMAYGPDGRLYATVLTDGARNGGVYVMGDDGRATLYVGGMVSPSGLAFGPDGLLYVSARQTPTSGGVIWRADGQGLARALVTDLPCCYQVIDNQVNGLAFGPDGALYVGVGALTDRLEATEEQARSQPYATLMPLEAAVLRVDTDSGAVTVYARGLRNAYDVAFAADGRLFATDNGVRAGPGDRVVSVVEGGHYGWPYWRARGCNDCPPTDFTLEYQPDLLTLPNYTLPRGLTVYEGAQFPSNFAGVVFVALWNGTATGQRVVMLDLNDAAFGTEGYTAPAFMTGLIRPVDVVVAPDGTLVVADYIYGNVWRVRYGGELGLVVG